KDIHELFMDTGIGTQAYSMVGQGKMDLILSSKPEDRRYLFEEAAGIIKYKNRKRLAMRRLESAEQNLLRLGDIIAEVQRQMRSLKRQVNAAIRYRELSDQLRDIEIRAAWFEFVRLTTEIAELRKNFASSGKRLEQLTTQITKLEARQEEVGLSRLEVERVRLARQQGVHEIDSEMEKIERQIALLRQQIAYADEKREQAQEDQTTLEQRANALVEQISGTGGRAEDVRRELAAHEESIARQSAEHAELADRVAKADEHLERMRKVAAERMTDRARTQSAIETLAENIGGIDAQLERVYEEQNSVSTRREELLSVLETDRARESEKQSELADAERRRQEVSATREQQTASLQDLDEQWRTQREEKSSIEARLNSLRELRDNYEGFAVGVRAIMKASSKDMLKGIIGPVGDLLSSDKKFEKAIEAALGGNINNIVVDVADAAKDAISFLKQHNAGRVTFLPLDTIRGGLRDDGSSLKDQPGVIGAAIDFVRFEPNLRSAVEYLLYSTVIVETLDDAIRITRTRTSHPRLVTLDGEVVSAAGAVTGGRTRHESRGLLGRSAEITELEERAAQSEKRIGEIASERQQLAEALTGSAQELRDLDARLTGLRKEVGDVGVAIARASAELDNLVQSGRALDERRNELGARREQL
ncbi:MAG: hypothetical protein KJ060_22675, partial [Candidatus Hydrogenedentes bacterium]|nr:hypothetical protein [Candidatus Hydrogenedentota bacterium]